MVYTRAVVTALLAAGAVSSALAAPATSTGTGEIAARDAGGLERRRLEFYDEEEHHDIHPHVRISCSSQTNWIYLFFFVS